MTNLKWTEEMILEMARQAYRNGNAGYEVAPQECALLVIDMQDEFVKPEWTPYWVPEAWRQAPKIKSLIEFCRGRDIPVIYTVYSKQYQGMDRYPWGSALPNRFEDRPEYFRKSRVWADLAPAEDEIVIHKPTYGAFCGTALDIILKNMRKNTVIICGTLTNFCCGATARQAYELGYKILFGSDVTAADDPEMQEAELMVLRKGFAKVLSAEQIMRELSGS